MAGKCIFGAGDMDIRIEDISHEELPSLLGRSLGMRRMNLSVNLILLIFVQQPFIEIRTLEEELARFDVPVDHAKARIK